MSSKGNAAEVQLYKDISSFYADPFAFVRYAYPWGKPGFLQNHEGPDKWQKEFLIELGEQVKQRAFDGFQPVAPVRMCVVSGHGVGKSVLAAWLVHWILSTRPNCRGSVTANTFAQLSTKTWATVQRWSRLLINKHWFQVTSDSMYYNAQMFPLFLARKRTRKHSRASTRRTARLSISSMKPLLSQIRSGKLRRADFQTASRCFSPLATPRETPESFSGSRSAMSANAGSAFR